MSSTESSKAEQEKKRARDMDILASIDVNKRAKDLSKKLFSLHKDFPEVKYSASSEKLLKQVVKMHKDARIRYAEEKEANTAKKCKIMIHKGESAPLYSLPDEVLVNCLSYVGNGQYALVGFASKKLNEAYKAGFGKETAYLEMATSVKLANHCLNEFCHMTRENNKMLRASAVNGNLDISRYAVRSSLTDEMLIAAAVNGNLDILRDFVNDGYDLSPLIEVKKKTIYQCGDGNYIDDDSFETGICEDDFKYKKETYYTDNGGNTVEFSRIVEKGHLHVLKYLHEELNYHEGLQRYVKPAIKYGQIEILEWLHSIGCMRQDHKMFTYYYDVNQMNYQPFAFCEEAVRCGNVQALQWLLSHEYGFGEHFYVEKSAIRSESLEMIRFCHGLSSYHKYDAETIKETRNVDVYRLLHELGFQFRGEITDWWIDNKRYWSSDPLVSYWSSDPLAIPKQEHQDRLDIIKFLRSISIPWGNDIMRDIVKCGTLEMIQYAHEDGCPWTGEEYNELFGWSHRWSNDKFKYLVDNGCTVDYEKSWDLICGLKSKKKLQLLDHFVGKNSSFDNKLFKEFLSLRHDDSWFEGISYLLKKGKDIQNFKSLEEVFQFRENIDGIKYFHSLGLPWCLDSSRNTHLLSKIACYNDLEDVKWAYENGCKGGNVVPYVNEEWGKYRIRDSSKWKANQVFFEENGLLDEVILERCAIKKLDSKNVQEIGDDKLV